MPLHPDHHDTSSEETSPPRWLIVGERWVGYAAALSVLVLLGLTFLWVPNERVMGAVQRIFYFHVGSAIACYVAFGAAFLTGTRYLIKNTILDDCLNEACGEVGFLFCTITLSSGMIWGHAAWNTWFRWEPRLVTFLLLWMIFFTFVLVRSFGEVRFRASSGAILSILGSATVPLVWLSIRLMPQSEQLHPQVVEHQGLRDYRFVVTFLVAQLALVLLMSWLCFVRARLGLLERKKLYGNNP
jgi:heme exporter protein C